jgi:hypothetical protein
MNSLNIGICMRMMGIHHWLLALASKGLEDRTTLSFSFPHAQDVLNGIFTKTTDSMVLQVSGRQAVAFVLKVLDSTKFGLAVQCRTWKEMNQTSIDVLDRDIGLEKQVDWGPPGQLRSFCEVC